MTQLNRESPVPLYHQLEASLLELIRERNLTTGDLFPSESELVRRFAVTRPTVRHAVERLAQRGVLYRERGRGTFVGDAPRVRTESGVGSLKILMPSLTSVIHLKTLAGAVQEARANGLELVLAHSDMDAQLEARQIAAIESSPVSGLLLWPLGGATERAALASVRAAGVPCVLLDRYLDDIDTDHVVVDDANGAYDATAHLTALGHRRIAFVLYEDVDVSSVRLRLEGYHRALGEHGVRADDRLIFRHPILPNATGLELMDGLAGQILSDPSPPTAAFCVNDHLAQALLIVLRRRGVAVPGDFSIVGFDGLEYIPSHQELTTVRRATDEMGREAVRIAVGRLNGQLQGPPRHTVLPTELVVGETSGPPKGGEARPIPA